MSAAAKAFGEIDPWRGEAMVGEVHAFVEVFAETPASVASRFGGCERRARRRLRAGLAFLRERDAVRRPWCHHHAAATSARRRGYGSARGLGNEVLASVPWACA